MAFKLLFCLIAVVSAAVAASAQGNASGAAAGLAKTIEGKVVTVHDGNRITVLDKSRKTWNVRLAGIDAPDLNQPGGDAARQELSDLVFGQTVRVEISRTDDYGQTVGKVLVETPNPEPYTWYDADLALVRRGLAWHYTESDADQSPHDRDFYTMAEADARKAGIGIWADKNPIPPWAFRKAAVVKAKTESDSRFNSVPTSGSVTVLPVKRVLADKHSHTYYLQDCPDHDGVAEKNRVFYNSTGEAEAAGYRIAKNCSAKK